MNLELPDHARVEIFISTDHSSALHRPMQIALPAPVAPAPASKTGGRLLMGGVAFLLVTAAYTVGYRTGLPPSLALRIPQAQAHLAEPPALHAKPGEVPPGFTQQLRQPPIVTPPPGAAAGSPTPKTGFGLED